MQKRARAEDPDFIEAYLRFLTACYCKGIFTKKQLETILCHEVERRAFLSGEEIYPKKWIDRIASFANLKGLKVLGELVEHLFSQEIGIKSPLYVRLLFDQVRRGERERTSLLEMLGGRAYLENNLNYLLVVLFPILNRIPTSLKPIASKALSYILDNNREGNLEKLQKMIKTIENDIERSKDDPFDQHSQGCYPDGEKIEMMGVCRLL